MVRPGARLTVVLLPAAASALAQRVISAKAGLVYFAQGQVSVEGSGPLRAGRTSRQLKNGETLCTDRGRAEVLLNPGTVLRLGDRSRMRMDDVQLTGTRVAIESGSAVVTVNYLLKEDRIELSVGGSVIVLQHAGLFRVDAAGSGPAQAGLRVYSGRAGVHLPNTDANVIVTRGQSVELEDLQITKFDTKQTDALQQWAKARSRTPAPRGFRPTPPLFEWRFRAPGS